MFKENSMKHTVLSVLLAATVIAGSAPAFAAGTPNVCIDTRSIKDSHQVDNGKALMFTMNDGTVYRNDLKGGCPDLVYNGYVWVIRNPDNTVCGNEQTIEVLQSGQICQIGAFVKQPAQSKVPG